MNKWGKHHKSFFIVRSFYSLSTIQHFVHLVLFTSFIHFAPTSTASPTLLHHTKVFYSHICKKNPHSFGFKNYKLLKWFSDWCISGLAASSSQTWFCSATFVTEWPAEALKMHHVYVLCTTWAMYVDVFWICAEYFWRTGKQTVDWAASSYHIVSYGCRVTKIDANVVPTLCSVP